MKLGWNHKTLIPFWKYRSQEFLDFQNMKHEDGIIVMYKL